LNGRAITSSRYTKGPKTFLCADHIHLQAASSYRGATASPAFQFSLPFENSSIYSAVDLGGFLLFNSPLRVLFATHGSIALTLKETLLCHGVRSSGIDVHDVDYIRITAF